MTSIPRKIQTMQHEQTPRYTHQERTNYAGYAQDLPERFQSGLLSELTAYPQFVVWKYTVEQGKLKKRPFNPRTHTAARTNDPSTWTSLEPSLKALATGRYNGIGFVFSRADPFTGIALDSCVGKDCTLASWAKELITTLDTYTEYSPSKLGVHLLTQATLPEAGKKAGQIELYSQDRYFTLTTDQVPETPTAIAERQDAIAALYHRLVPVGAAREFQNTGVGVGRGRALTELPPEAGNDPVLQRLLRGDISGYASQSSADFVLLMKLLHWTGDDIHLSKELFLASPLGQRSKASDPHGQGRRGQSNYLDKTIERIQEKRRNQPMKR